LAGGVAEPDLDRGDVDRAAEDELALVDSQRDSPEVPKLADRPLDGVAFLVGLGVERRWPPAGRSLDGAGLCWSAFSGIVAVIRRLRSSPRILRLE
jgi:hypothetical protein